MKKLLFIFSFLVITQFVNAQTHQYAGWLTWIHQQKINKNFTFLLDAQLRSGAQFNGVSQVLFRPALSLNLDKNWSLAAGYTFIDTKVNSASSTKPHLQENMIVEQIQRVGFLKNTQMLNRLRFEQRFVEQQTRNIFTQRLRFFNRFVMPLSSKKISDGIYLVMQDELLFNIQNKEKLNTHFFDQNRAFIGLGHQLNTHFSLEGGYQQIDIKGKINYQEKRIFQVSVFTKF